jgi:CYTH domain-containing protein
MWSNAQSTLPAPANREDSISPIVCRENVGNLDVFQGDNTGLVVAEIEVRSESEQFERPPWLGREVSTDLRYLNSGLVNNPYNNWRRRSD